MCRPGIECVLPQLEYPSYPIGCDPQRDNPKRGPNHHPAEQFPGSERQKLTPTAFLILIDAHSHPVCRATLVCRDDETVVELLQRLDEALGKAMAENTTVDEVLPEIKRRRGR